MIIFFIREFNDVDHLVPIIYKLAVSSSRRIRVLCQNPAFDITNDFRLKYLREKCGIKAEYIYTCYCPSLIHRFFAFLICYKHSGKLFSGKYIDKGIFDKFIKKKIFNKSWAKTFLQATEASLLIFDHIESDIYITEALLQAAQELKISTVGAPNGLPLFSKGYVRHADLYQRGMKTSLDYIIEPHKRIADYRIRNGVDADKVKIMGSARYCQEWEDVLQKIVPKSRQLNGDRKNKLKIVYMERGLDLHGKYKDVIKNTLIKIGQLDFVHFVIKPHTRARKLHFKAFPD